MSTKLILASALVLYSTSAAADKLDDFKRALSETGCKSIPYSDLSYNCSNQQSPVHEWCDGGKGPVSCGSEGTSRRLTDALDAEKRNQETLKQKRKEADDKRYRSTDEKEKAQLTADIEALDKAIYESGKAVDKATDDVNKRKELVNGSIYNIGYCLDYRRAVMNTFAAAQDRVRNENDTPELQSIARELRDRYEESKRGHNIAITDKENALYTCKRETL